MGGLPREEYLRDETGQEFGIHILELISFQADDRVGEFKNSPIIWRFLASPSRTHVTYF